MKIFGIILAIFLVACGSNSNTGVVGAASPQPSRAPIGVEVPANAEVTDYVCDMEWVYRQDGVNGTDKDEYHGVSKFWREGDWSWNLVEENDYANLTKSKSEKLGENRKRTQSELSEFILENGVWSRTNHTILRTSETIDGITRVVENIVDGIMKPYFWETRTWNIDDKTSITEMRHTNPSVKNKNGREYQSITQKCRDTIR